MSDNSSALVAKLNLRECGAIAEKIATYQHARSSAAKLAGDQNNALRARDDVTVEELRAEIMRLLSELSSAGILESMRRHSARMA